MSKPPPGRVGPDMRGVRHRIAHGHGAHAHVYEGLPAKLGLGVAPVGSG